MLHFSDAKITVFLVSVVVAIGCATATHHKNQRLMTIGKHLKRDAPVGSHFVGGNIHTGGFGQQGHQQQQQFQLQQTLSHQGLDGHQGSHFVMPHYSFGALGHQQQSQGHNFAGTAQFAQLAKILNTQAQAGAFGGQHGFGGGNVGGFSGQSYAAGLKTSPVTFAAAPSTSYGTPAAAAVSSSHLGGLGGGGLQGASFVGGHNFGGSLGGGLQGLSSSHSLGNSFGGSSSFKGADFGANNHLLLSQNYAPSFSNLHHHQLPALAQSSSSAQTVPAYAMGIKGLGHYSSGGGIQSYGDLGTQASLGGHGSLGALSFDTSKYNIPTYSNNGKTLAPLALSSNVAPLRHTSISNIVDQMKNPFKPSVLLGMYTDGGFSAGDSHGYGSHQNFKFSQNSLPSFSNHNSAAGLSYDGTSGYNTINYSEGTGH